MPWHAFSVQDLLATGDLGFRSVAALRQARRIIIISKRQDHVKVHRERFTCRKKTYDVPTVDGVQRPLCDIGCPMPARMVRGSDEVATEPTRGEYVRAWGGKAGVGGSVGVVRVGGEGRQMTCLPPIQSGNSNWTSPG